MVDHLRDQYRASEQHPTGDVLKRISLLKHHNARGSHIYIRPSGEHRYTVLDDLNETMLGQLASGGFIPCAVVETSAGNFQAWLKHRSVFSKLLGCSQRRTARPMVWTTSRLHKLQT
jgi:hypothetical protein